MASVESSAAPGYQQLLKLKRRESLEKLWTLVRDQGPKRTWRILRGDLAPTNQVGYSAAGVVIGKAPGVEDFQVGDTVACAGAEIANHAEYIDVPVKLAVKVPDGVPTDIASTVTLGAIALQGVRRCNPTLGETVLVIGLGILGQITAQLLKANGCTVVGTDLDSRRVQLAVAGGLAHGIDASLENTPERVFELTRGIGADAVIITAATSSHQVVRDAMNSCRKKGRVVLVGNVGLNLNRQDFYKKELDFLISCAYGPGRYDPRYEEDGQDYPLPYVRWTENRNMEAYLRLVGEGRIQLGNLPSRTYPVEDARRAYEAIGASSEKPLLVYLEYPKESAEEPRKTVIRPVTARSGRTRVALVGAGGFAQGVHLPNLARLRKDYEIRAVVSRSGPNAVNMAKMYDAAYATTEYRQVLDDADVDLVILCTRHHLHGAMTLEALKAGKHVLVEKPLCIDPRELEEIREFFQGSADRPVLTTGFNRRFSPPIQRVRELLKRRQTPVIVNYRMNAGYIPRDHWVHGEEGGGRNIGEACHIYDLFNCLTDSAVASVHAASIEPASSHRLRSDNFVATLKYIDGSLCTLTYTALGAKSFPKEKLELYVDGRVIAMDDFRSVEVFGSKQAGWRSAQGQKGHLEELECLAACLRSGRPWPIPLEQQISATEVSFKVQEQIG